MSATDPAVTAVTEAIASKPVHVEFEIGGRTVVGVVWPGIGRIDLAPPRERADDIAPIPSDQP